MEKKYLLPYKYISKQEQVININVWYDYIKNVETNKVFG